jgi:hypothetical protein
MKRCANGGTGLARFLLHISARAWMALFTFSLGTNNDHASIRRESWVPESLPPPVELSLIVGILILVNVL